MSTTNGEGLPQRVRDGVLLTFGILGVAHETMISSEPSLPLLFIFGACMGLPAFLGIDRFFGSPK